MEEGGHQQRLAAAEGEVVEAARAWRSCRMRGQTGRVEIPWRCQYSEVVGRLAPQSALE